MRDANEFYLNQHLKEIEKQDKRDEWINREVEFLMSEEHDYYPWSHDNVLEALENRKKSDEMFLTSCIIAGCTAKNPLGAMEWVGNTVKKVIFEYWKERAEKQADVNFMDKD